VRQNIVKIHGKNYKQISYASIANKDFCIECGLKVHDDEGGEWRYDENMGLMKKLYTEKGLRKDLGTEPEAPKTKKTPKVKKKILKRRPKPTPSINDLKKQLEELKKKAAKYGIKTQD
jgi:hypothetical protein